MISAIRVSLECPGGGRGKGKRESLVTSVVEPGGSDPGDPEKWVWLNLEVFWEQLYTPMCVRFQIELLVTVLYYIFLVIR